MMSKIADGSVHNSISPNLEERHGESIYISPLLSERKKSNIDETERIVRKRISDLRRGKRLRHTVLGPPSSRSGAVHLDE